jgi:hypothetical protein
LWVYLISFLLFCTLVADNKEAKHDAIEEVNTLFERLRQAATSTDNLKDTNSLKPTLPDLNPIYSRLGNPKCSNAFYTLDTFEIIIKKYIKLLDTDSFVNAIAHHHSIANNDFLRSLLDIPHQYDVWKLFDEMTSRNRQKMYFSLFDSLSSSKRIISYLQNKLSKISNNDDDNQTVANSCGSILHVILQVSDYLKVSVTGKDLEKYQYILFVSFITFLDEHFMNKKCSKTKEQLNDLLIKTMLSFLWNTTDKTSTIPILIYTNCPRACLRWISLSYLNIQEYQCLISILHNIARHDEGAILLNKYECPKILRQFKNQMLNGKLDFIINKQIYTDMLNLLHMTLALVIDPDELRGDAVDNTIISNLLSITISASKTLRFRYEGFHISEPLIVLMKLCVNDATIDYILQQNDIVSFFCTILRQFLTIVKNKNAGDPDIDFDVLTIVALGNILWSISFHKRYRNDLIN